MKNKIKSIFYIITLSFLSCTLNAGEWVNMFDGKTLEGWKVNTENPKTFSVVDGTIKVFGPRAHMFYGKDGNAKFKDFEFECEVKTAKGANAGIFSTLLIRRMDGLKLVMRPRSMQRIPIGERQLVSIVSKMLKKHLMQMMSGSLTISKLLEKK